MSYRDDLDAARARHAALSRERDEVRARLGDRDALVARERELSVAIAETSRGLDHARARASLPLLANVRIASPCHERWDTMTGDARMRHCGRCDKNVYDLSSMTAAEAEAVLGRPGGAPCVKLYRRADGTVITSDCPVGVRRRQRHRFALAGVAVALVAAAGGLAARLRGREPAARPHAEEVMGVVEEPREAVERIPVSPVSDPNSPL